MIGKLLGHRHVTTTARYAHLDDGPVIEAGAAYRRPARRNDGCARYITLFLARWQSPAIVRAKELGLEKISDAYAIGLSGWFAS